MRLESASAREKALARLAGNQHGVVSFQQLREIGFTQPAIARRVRAGRLHRLHRGVYAVGHTRLTDEGRWKAAVLACGPGAALSHRAAAASWRMLPAPKGPIDVTVPGHDGRKRRKGIRLHRSNSLHPAQTTLRAGIPVTTPARTLADLRRYTTPDELRDAQRQAELHGYRLDSQDNLSDLTRSELERRFVRLCRRHALPPPEVNARIGEFVVDFLWRHRSLVVETDGYRYHRGRAAFEYDYRRQARLVTAGFEVLRFTWRQVVDEPRDVFAAIRVRLEPSASSARFVRRR